jgi:hypothetical protein
MSTVPRHDPLRVGSVAAILADVAGTHAMTRDELLQRLLNGDSRPGTGLSPHRPETQYPYAFPGSMAGEGRGY